MRIGVAHSGWRLQAQVAYNRRGLTAPFNVSEDHVNLICLRHGETNYNLLGLCNDNPQIDVHLTARGIEQAQVAARSLAAMSIARIFVSELPRTRQTAQIINEAHGAPILVHAALNDWRTGLDGKPVAELYARIADDRLHTRIDGGETLFEHKQRVLGFIAWLRAQPPAPTLVVAHEETLRVFCAHFRRLADDEMLALRFGNAEMLAFSL
jgi:probable phosphoglycerate mutase